MSTARARALNVATLRLSHEKVVRRGARHGRRPMSDERLADALGEQNRYGVPDLPRRGPDPTREDKVTWKRLKACRLSDTDRPVLGWVTEPAIGNARAL